MDVNLMRVALLKVYPGWKWKSRVDKMADDQVIAIYYNFVERGLVNGIYPTDKAPSKPRPTLTEIKDSPDKIGYGYNAVQLSMFDIL